MRTILSLIAIFSVCTMQAGSPSAAAATASQKTPASNGRELPGSQVVVCSTAAEAAQTGAAGAVSAMEKAAADTELQKAATKKKKSKKAAASEPKEALPRIELPAKNLYLTPIGDWSRQGGTFSTPFTVPFDWANRQVMLHIESAAADYRVRVNGREVAYNADGNTPADFNLTLYVQDGRNALEIELLSPSPVAALESWKQNAAPSVGAAWITSPPTLHIRDMVARTTHTEDGIFTAEIGLVVKTHSLNSRTSRVYYELVSPTGEVAATGHNDITLAMRGEDTVRFLARIPAEGLWSAERPVQYILRVKTQHEGRYVEYMEFRLGLRSIEMHNGAMSINGAPVTLRAREVSPQITRDEIVRLRAEGYNTLRLQPGAVSATLYDYCDALGMYVIAQAPIDTQSGGESRLRGGNPSNDPQWQAAYVERIANCYHTAKRHASVVAFSLATKSANGICLYESYMTAKRFGDTRPMIYPDAAGEWNSDKLVVQ